MKSKLWAYFFLLYFSGIQIHAQNFNVSVDHIDTQDGLLHRNVQSVFEDDNGFLWIGSLKGLQRYDGHEFKIWTKASRTGLLYHVSCIAQDDEGWLWLWNNDKTKFVFLHPETEEILSAEERFTDFPITRSENSKIVWNSFALKNAKGQLCFTTTKGEIITYAKDTGFDTINIEEIDQSILFRTIDSNGNYWITPSNEESLAERSASYLYKVSPEGIIKKRYPLGHKYINTRVYEIKDQFYFLLVDNVSSVNQLAWIDHDDSVRYSSEKFDNLAGIYEADSKLFFIPRMKE